MLLRQTVLVLQNLFHCWLWRIKCEQAKCMNIHESANAPIITLANMDGSFILGWGESSVSKRSVDSYMRRWTRRYSP